MSSELLLEIQSLSVAYERNCATRPLTARLSLGDQLLLIGGNASGKTTLLRVLHHILAGAPLAIDALFVSGSVSVLLENQSVLNFPPATGSDTYSGLRKPIFSALLKRTSTPPVHLSLTALENVRVAAATFSQSSSWSASAYLDLVGLPPRLIHRKAAVMSGGERGKLAIASILASGRRILLIDEPLVGLDTLSRESVLKTLADLLRQKRVTTIVADQEKAHYQRMVSDIHYCEIDRREKKNA